MKIQKKKNLRGGGVGVGWGSGGGGVRSGVVVEEVG